METDRQPACVSIGTEEGRQIVPIQQHLAAKYCGAFMEPIDAHVRP